MNDTQTTHPAADELAAFAQGRLGPARQAELERHVADCDRCCQALRAVPDDTLLTDLLRQGPAPSTACDPASATHAQPPAVPDVPPELRDHPRYRVLRVLGTGGMGVVYQAEHRLMERPVALKVLNAALLRRPGAVERFRREVKAAARLAHPNIVAAYDADQAGGLHFLVMEYVEGTDLARLVEKRGPLPVAHACHFARQAALGLQHAHERGMVHRDVKPQNLMVTRKGQVKVLDFGLARLARPAGAEPAAGGRRPRTAAVTQIGAVLGTPDYIAPEQVGDSHAADGRADVYSLGATLYFLLAGHPPFPEGSAAEKAAAHVGSRPAPVTARRGDVPADLAAVLERLMAKAPDARYQTPAEAAQALAPFVKAGPAGDGETEVVALPEVEPEPPPRPKGRRARAAKGRRLGLLLAALPCSGGPPAAAPRPAATTWPPAASAC